jgi:hypothetical protein
VGRRRRRRGFAACTFVGKQRPQQAREPFLLELRPFNKFALKIKIVALTSTVGTSTFPCRGFRDM